MKAFYLALGFFLISPEALPQAQLLKDTNDEANGGTGFSITFSTMNAVEFNGRMYFPARDTRSHVFSTDGTVEGTTMLPEPEGGYIYTDRLAVLDGSLIISENHFLKPTKIWKTDGVTTPELIAEVNLGDQFVVMNDVIYFAFDNGESGSELWRTDGTGAGTYMLKDIADGVASSLTDFGYMFTAVGNALFFFADDGVHGKELWKSDGTPGGTALVADIKAGAESGIPSYTEPTAIGNDVYFVAYDAANNLQFWKSNGTEAGTAKLTSFFILGADRLRGGIGDKWIALEFDFGGPGYTPYVLDVSTGNYSELTVNDPDFDGVYSNSSDLFVEIDNMIYFIGYMNDGFGLWKTDGTTANTEFVTGIELPDNHYPNFLKYNGEELLVSSANNDGESLLMVSDGESEFTAIKEIYSVDNMYAFGDKFLLNASDGVHGNEPWVSDGTTEGTFMLQDIETRSTTSVVAMASTSDRIVFTDSDGKGNYFLWGSDGTEEGTILLKEGKVFNYFQLLRSNGNKVLFGWDDKVHGGEPWITDGTGAGTFMLKDIVAGAETSLNFNGLRGAWVGNVFFFFTGDTQLWKTDGTPQGTTLVTDELAGQFHNVTGSAGFKDQFYFLFENELWKSDGTKAGTVMVKKVTDANGGVTYLAAGENRLFFNGRDPVDGYTLWTSDGTTEGTHLVKDIYKGSNDYNANVPQFVANDILYMWASDDDSPARLWRSDGTEAGTYQLKDVKPGGDLNTDRFWIANRTIFFSAYDEADGGTLWKTDGTEQGTVKVKSFGLYSGVEVGTALDGRLYFTAFDGTDGTEAWESDGTAEGTKIVTDVNSIRSRVATTLDHKLFFSVNEPVHGSEVWVYDPNRAPQTITFEEIPDKKSTDDPFELVATASSGLPVTFEILSGPAMVDGSMLTLTGGGSVVVRASQDGDDNHRPASAEQSFEVELIVGIENGFEAVQVWPNPATQTLLVNDEVNSVVMLDMLGRNIFSTEKETTIDVSQFPRGVYIIELTGKDMTKLVKRVILK